MNTILTHSRQPIVVVQNPVLPKWHWISLLIILGYEAAGCLLGGVLLILAPDGRLMKMPVEMMHGVFPDFLIPGIILFGLGLLNTIAFAAILQRSHLDWLLGGIGLGGLVIWFVVEIVILQELHWLHIMWGYPVLLGCILILPLGALRNESVNVRRGLLVCGILSSLWYVAINIIVPVQWSDYHVSSQTVSELSAFGAPTRRLWVLLVLAYPILFAAFGWGVREVATVRRLRWVGSLIVAYSIFNLYWPPMHLRDVLAAGAGTLTDTLHIVWASASLLLMLLLMGLGAAALSKSFQIFTLIIWVVFIAFGVLTFMNAPAMQANLPTPWIGIWERINIGAFLLWVIVFAIILLNNNRIENKMAE